MAYFKLPLFLCLALCLPALAQRPDAGILSKPQERLAPPPKSEAPPITLPQVKPTTPGGTSTTITPAAFRFEGNTAFDDETLAQLLANRVGKPTDLAGLELAAATITEHYKAHGYLLTDAYIPEQTFVASGGVVTIAVLEARVGRVTVVVQGDGISQTFAQSIVDAHLKPNDLISEYLLDKPVLLLRDLAGYNASAQVAPGARVGQADITVTVSSVGVRTEGSIGLDNFGTSTAGANRAFANLNVNNLWGRGDVLKGHVQLTDMAPTKTYQLGYALPVGGWGTRVGATVAHTTYALGGQFESLGASGHATITSAALTHPLFRSRRASLYGVLSFEHKKMKDQLTTPVFETRKQISSTRLGLLGNFVDAFMGGSALNAGTLSLTSGRLRLDTNALSTDQAAGGLGTAGHFTKLNADYQREQHLSKNSTLSLTLQGQVASKNIASAEKMSLGGPTGVRGYSAGEGVGDAGMMMNLEYRYMVPSSSPSPSLLEPLQLLAFYDKGWVKINQMGASPVGASNHINLGSVGVGVRVGQEGRFLTSVHLAWRTTPTVPTTGDPDRRPRVWASMQKWF